MAQKVQVITYSDLSGKEGASAVTFGFSGSTYEIDLTGKEQDELAATLQPYVASGRRVTGRTATKGPAAAAGRRGKSTETRPNPRDVRVWAAKKGIKVSDRGRVPANVMDRYLADRSS
ncbi:MAG TPA: Lsr2 family protein [Mycobacteriales bacterium]|nr:Lsr2 family protein [Mycobacteriales bacterium]